ncbi:MAG: hypothetical protein H6737_19645 [Alphaproteobacteria bacterium]|nr:hypothetical protein [Alphaproteobacteria bacterium]
MTLTLGETWQPWHPSVRRGVLDEDDGPREVLVVLAPFQPSGVARAREAAADLDLYARKRAPVLRLLDIRGHNNRIAYVYESVDGIAVSHLTGDRQLGLRAAAELVASVAAALGGPAQGHPGPEPDDVLLCADGSVRIAGFIRALPGISGPRAPGEGTAEARLVYRLGALLAFLLGGPLPVASTEESHEAAVRRAQIRAMSSPGAVFSESYGNWLRGLLAWDPVARPPLSRAIAGLADLAASTAGPSLAETCEWRFDGWLVELVGSDPEETTLPASWEDELGDVIEPLPTVEAGRRTLGEDQVLGDLHAEDDPTVDSELGVVPEYTPPSIIERGSIPVSVGPPAEVAAKRPSLPVGLFTDDTQTEIDSSGVAGRGATPAPDARPAWLLPAIVVLVGCAVGLGWWLLFG